MKVPSRQVLDEEVRESATLCGVGGHLLPRRSVIWRCTALAGDRYLVCAGGPSLVVDRKALQKTLTATSEPRQTVQRLLELAEAEGAPDDVARIVADFVAV